MAYIYRDTVNIYDKEAIARAIKTQETQFNVLQGKIQALITDSELEILRNGGSTMYSRMTNVEATADGLTSQVSSLRTDLQDNYSTTESMRSEIQQSADSITSSVSTAIGGLNTRMETAESKITSEAIISTVASTNGARAMVSAINQTASTVQISAAHINLIGAVTADCIAAGAITTDKLGAGAVTASKIDVNDLFSQNITATGTITGATISGGTISGGTITGATIATSSGNIGGWNITAAGLESPDGLYSFTPEAWTNNQLDKTAMSLRLDGLDLRVSGHTTTIGNHEDRITALEGASPTYPDVISCTTLTVTGGGNALIVNHGISCTEVNASGHISTSSNITGGELYTQTTNAGTGSNAVVTGTGRVAPISASSRRYKDHISSVTLDEALKVLDIPVINFRYKDGYLAKGDEMEGVTMPGFYAEDIAELIPEAIYHNREGKVENWRERIIIPLMLKVIQNQQHQIDELMNRSH